MNALVTFEFSTFRETLTTQVAAIGPLSCVSALVYFEMSLLIITLATQGAAVRPPSCVNILMKPELRPKVEGFVTHRTGVVFAFLCLCSRDGGGCWELQG